MIGFQWVYIYIYIFNGDLFGRLFVVTSCVYTKLRNILTRMVINASFCAIFSYNLNYNNKWSRISMGLTQ